MEGKNQEKFLCIYIKEKKKKLNSLNVVQLLNL